MFNNTAAHNLNQEEIRIVHKPPFKDSKIVNISLIHKTKKESYYSLQIFNTKNRKLDFKLQKVGNKHSSTSPELLSGNLWVEPVNIFKTRGGRLDLLFNVVKQEKVDSPRERFLVDRNLRRIFKFSSFCLKDTPDALEQSVFANSQMLSSSVFNDITVFEVEKNIRIEQQSKFFENLPEKVKRIKKIMKKANFKIYYCRRNKKVILKNIDLARKMTIENNSIAEFIKDHQTVANQVREKVRELPPSSMDIRDNTFKEPLCELRFGDILHTLNSKSNDQNNLSFQFQGYPQLRPEFGQKVSLFTEVIKEEVSDLADFSHSDLVRSKNMSIGGEQYVIGCAYTKFRVQSELAYAMGMGQSPSFTAEKEFTACAILSSPNLEGKEPQLMVLKVEGFIKGSIRSVKLSPDGNFLIVYAFNTALFLIDTPRNGDTRPALRFLSNLEDYQIFSKAFFNRNRQVLVYFYDRRERVLASKTFLK